MHFLREQRSRGAEEQRSRGAEEQRSRGAEEQRSRGAEVHSTSVEGLFSGFSLSFFSFFKLANSFLDGLYFVGVFFTCRKTRLVEKQDL